MGSNDNLARRINMNRPDRTPINVNPSKPLAEGYNWDDSHFKTGRLDPNAKGKELRRYHNYLDKVKQHFTVFYRDHDGELSSRSVWAFEESLAVDLVRRLCNNILFIEHVEVTERTRYYHRD